MQEKLYFHSPFSETSAYNAKNKALLLSFTLSDLFACIDDCSLVEVKSCVSFQEKAYDTPLCRLQEHTELLSFAFPMHRAAIFKLRESLSCLIGSLSYHLMVQTHTILQEIFKHLEPLIRESKEDNHFVFFLLTHHKEISSLTNPSYFLSLLHEFCPEGLTKLQNKLCDFFHRKGFTNLLPKISMLLQQVKQDEIKTHEPSSC